MKFQNLNEWTLNKLNENSNQNVTILYPGGFKPMTGGHLNLIKKYFELSNVNSIQILIGSKERDGISQEDAIKVAAYISKEYPKMEIGESKYPSPILTAYKYIEEASPGIYALASSSKGKDYDRVQKFVTQHQPGGKYYDTMPTGVSIIELPVDVSPEVYQNRNDNKNGEPISATIAREDLKNNDFGNFMSNYPQLTEEEIIEIWNILQDTLNEATVPSGYSEITPEDRYKSLFVEADDSEEENDNENNDNEEEEEWTDEEIDAYIQEINDIMKKEKEDIRIPYDYKVFPHKKEVNTMEDRDSFSNALKIAQSSPHIHLAIGYLVEENEDEEIEEVQEYAWNLDDDENVMDKTLGYSEDIYIGKKLEDDEVEKLEEASELEEILRKESNLKVNESLKRKNLKKKKLFEGGGAGHMKNIWEATDLTFKDLKEIVLNSLSGQLQNVTEKLDGQNLMVTWKEGTIRAARNKGQLKNFGENSLSISQISEYFEGKGAIQEAFVEGLQDLKNAFREMDKNLSSFFGEGKYWLNLEVLYPATENVIPYGDSQLRIHHMREIDESGKTVEIISGKEFQEFMNSLETIQNQQDKTFLIERTNSLTVKNIEQSQDIQDAIMNDIDDIKGRFDLSDNNTIQDYIDAKMKEYIEENLPTIPEEKEKMLIDRWAKGVKKPAINKLMQGLDREVVQKIREIDKEVKDLYKEILQPIEYIVLRLGTTVLNNLHGLATTNPTETSKKIQKKTEEAIQELRKEIHSEGQDSQKISKLQNFLLKQLERIEKAGGIDSIAPTEGIVFEYKGKLLKLTGNFAPVNQLIGQLKFKK